VAEQLQQIQQYPGALQIAGRSDVYLRLTAMSDIPELTELTRNNPTLGEFQPWAMDPADTPKWVAGAFQYVQDGLWVQHRIVHQPQDGSESIIGTVTLYADYDPVQPTKESQSLGYWIVPAYRRQGITLAAARTLVQHGAESGFLHNEVGLEIADANIPSQRLAKNLGAHPTEHVRDLPTGTAVLLHRRWSLPLHQEVRVS
jgi:RimJ/RimL family protein N-acetyltransferase